ncbi:MAG: SsrA-binding protein SmpB [Alphaproteobacteria bacterium]
MAAKKKKKKGEGDGHIVARNRRATFDYHIDEQFEAGMMLTGTEVKSLREGRASINEAYAGQDDGEIWLFNAYIPEYSHASHKMNHPEKRNRKLLLHKREIARIIGALQNRGITLVPMRIFFNRRGLAKIIVGIGRGKREIDKRQVKKDRDWNRQKSRLLRDRG